MNKTITLIFLCLFCTTSIFSQIDPFSSFKNTVSLERSTNIYAMNIGGDDSVEVVTQFDVACNPLNTVKSKWSYSDKKLLYQEKDSFSYVMVGTILRPASKTASIWRFDKQAWEAQALFTFSYPTNSPYFVERLTSVFDPSKQSWSKTAAESFLLDRKGNTLTYENYDPYNIPKTLLHKVAYEYTTWGALTYLKSERPSNGDWRTDSLKTVEYDGNRNRLNTVLTTYTYDKSDNLLTENTQKDSISNVYNNGVLVYRKIGEQNPSIDSFFYDAQKVLILAKNFKTNLQGKMDTSQVNLTYYENLKGKSFLQKKVFRRIMKLHNPYTNKDTAYWITSYTHLYTHNALNQITSIKSISSDPQVEYTISYAKTTFNYCGETSTSAKEIYEDLPYTISPNPVNQTLFIAFEAENDLKSSIQIMDVLGNTVKWISPEKGDFKPIDVSDFAAGIYFLKVQSGNKVGVRKFVVNR
jgi:Secretion system C-terminal sorting domain